MVGHPVERGVGEDEVERLCRRKRADVAALEPKSVARVRRRLREHRVGRIDADRLRGPRAPVQLGRQLARSAPEIDRAAARNRRDEIAGGRRTASRARRRSARSARGPRRRRSDTSPSRGRAPRAARSTSRAPSISRASSFSTPAASRLPRPTSTSVPARRRTIFQRKCDAVIRKWISWPTLARRRTSRRRRASIPGPPGSRRTTRKSCRPSKSFAARRIAAKSSRSFTHHTKRLVERRAAARDAVEVRAARRRCGGRGSAGEPSRRESR